MSNAVNFHPIVIRDERIQSITTDLPMELRKGGAHNTFQTQNATSMSTTGITFNVTPPSMDVVMDRHIKMSNRVTLRVAIPAGQTVNSRVFKYGETESLSAFPMNSLIGTATLTINSATVTVNTQDIFGVLSKMHDQKDFDEYHCPTMLDQKFKKYSDMQLSQSNPLGSFEDSKSNIVPRGAHPLESFTIVRSGTTPLTRTQADTEANIGTALTCTNTDQSWVITLTYVTIEPLLFLSPLIYGKSNNNAGLFGVNKLDLQLNIDPTAKRVFCSSTSVPMTVSLVAIEDSKLMLNYITPQSSDLIAPSNVVPYTEYSRYITAQTGNTVAAGANATVTSNSLQLNSIPNKFYIVVRKQLQNMTCKDSDSFLRIDNCVTQFNNMSGLFSSATQHDLYLTSKRNGSKQSAYEFYGEVSVKEGIKKPTIGSVLVLNPIDFGIPEYLTAGSTGNFNFQVTVGIKNTDSVPVTYELMILTQNDGIFILQKGQAMKQTSIYSKTLVAEATMSQFGESADYIRNQTSGPSLSNVNLLNMVKSGSGSAKSGGAMSAGGPVMNSVYNTGGDYTRRALSRLHSGI